MTNMTNMTNGEKLIKLLGYYAAHEDGSSRAMYHERLERLIESLGLPVMEFVHPMQEEILNVFDVSAEKWGNVILAGEAWKLSLGGVSALCTIGGGLSGVALSCIVKGFEVASASLFSFCMWSWLYPSSGCITFRSVSGEVTDIL